MESSSQPDKYSRRVGRPRQCDQPAGASTRELILEEAARLFLQHGYAGVSISEITQGVNITKPTLYHYFVDKENLFALVMINLMARLYEQTAPTLSADAPFSGKLALLLRCAARPGGITLSCLMRDAVEHLDDFHLLSVRGALRRYLIDPLENCLQEARARGEIRAQEPRLVAEFILGALDGIRLRHGFCDSPEYEATLAVSLDLLLRGLLAPGAPVAAEAPQA
ncbi:MAG: TetR/AcrR family transcriptional regulator [Vampirovibrionales bacterium]|nr:TetR/AcrR family transcriptional regulator [Vampirovibrionales bacterium]